MLPQPANTFVSGLLWNELRLRATFVQGGEEHFAADIRRREPEVSAKLVNVQGIGERLSKRQLPEVCGPILVGRPRTG